MEFDDIKNKKISDLDLTAGQLYEIFKVQQEKENDEMLARQWQGKLGTTPSK